MSAVSAPAMRAGTPGGTVDAPSATIKVAVRCRPLLPHEACEPGMRHCVGMDAAAGHVVVKYDNHARELAMMRVEDARGKHYRFDNVFPEDASDAAVYAAVVAPLVRQVERGFDATFFAYGQVGSGKTHSICGIMPLVGRDLLAFVHEHNAGVEASAAAAALATPGPARSGARGSAAAGDRIHLHAAYFELYNENILDLLVAGDASAGGAEGRANRRANNNNHHNNNNKQPRRQGGVSVSGGGGRRRDSRGGRGGGTAASSGPGLPGPLRIREHPQAGVFVENLSTCCVRTQDDFLRIVRIGGARRSTANHLMNARSSRSHSVLMLILAEGAFAPRARGAGRGGGGGGASNGGHGVGERGDGMLMQDVLRCVRVRGQLNLVDLAGSERASRTGTTGSRLKEGAAINKSLSCLGKVIKALAASHQPARGDTKQQLQQQQQQQSPPPQLHQQQDSRSKALPAPSARRRKPSTKSSSSSTSSSNSSSSGSRSSRHVPFRDSFLTRILQPSLLGSAHTTMLATCSPSLDDLDETISTLDYAQCASVIKHKAAPRRRLGGGGSAAGAAAAASGVDAAGLRDEVERLRRELARERAAAAEAAGQFSTQGAELVLVRGQLTAARDQLAAAHALAREQAVEIERLRRGVAAAEGVERELRRKVKSRESYAREMEVVVRDATSVILRDATRNSQSLQSLHGTTGTAAVTATTAAATTATAAAMVAAATTAKTGAACGWAGARQGRGHTGKGAKAAGQEQEQRPPPLPQHGHGHGHGRSRGEHTL